MAKRTKQASGLGSVFYNKKKERWEAHTPPLQINGKVRPKIFTGATQREVIERRAVWLKEYHKTGIAVDHRQTLAQFLTKWLETVQQTKGYTTWNQYRHCAENHIIPRIGKLKLQSLTVAQCKDFLDAIVKEGGATHARTVKKVLSSALSAACRQELLPRNPVRLVEIPTYRREKFQPLTVEDTQKFLQAISGHRYELFWFTMLATGRRPSEVLGFRWPDINLTERTYQIEKQLQVQKKAYLKAKESGTPFTDEFRNGVKVLAEPKRNPHRITHALPRALAERLQQWRRKQLEYKLKAGGHWLNEWDLVFTWEDGRPFSLSTIQHEMKRVVQEAGLPKFTPHKLRSQWASLQLLHKASLKEISAVLEHTKIATTSEFYAHILQEVDEKIAERADKFLVG